MVTTRSSRVPRAFHTSPVAAAPSDERLHAEVRTSSQRVPTVYRRAIIVGPLLLATRWQGRHAKTPGTEAG